jgi:4-amino-4-deoxy-L-arabinose transferase-like glycosyltransferase
MTAASLRAVDTLGVGLAGAAQGVRSYLLLTLLCLVLFAPGLATLPPMDRDEARFMQATRQMVESSNYSDIRFQDEPRTKKPVGIYWLQAVAVKAFGAGNLTRTWPYRLPSALAAWIAVLATCRIGGKLFDPLTGFIAGGMLATTLVVVTEAHLAKTDAALLATITLAMAALGEIYAGPEDRPRWRPMVQFWLALAAGTLIKGPVAPMVGGLTVLALAAADRSLTIVRRLRPVLGILLFVLIVAPWFLAQSDSGFAQHAFREDILPKLLGGQEGHGAPPGTHLVLSVITAWPWSLFVPFALIAAWQKRTQPSIRFCLAWLIPAWAVFELVPTKLPHYTLPLMPAVMLITAVWLRAFDITTATRGWSLAYRILWGWVCIALAVVVMVATRRYDGSVIAGTVASALALGAGILVLFAPLRRITTPLTLGALGGLFAVTTVAAVLPQMQQLTLSGRIAAAVTSHLKTKMPVALADYHEPSAVFLLGTHTILTDLAGVAAHLEAHPGAIGVVPMERVDALRDMLAAHGASLVQIDEVDGFNYSRGRWQRLTLVAAGPQPP